MTIPALTLRVLGGLALGGMFYGGLWFTVERLIKSAAPPTNGERTSRGASAGIAMSSLLVRFALALAGFIWMTNGRWQNALACLAGFEAARLAIVRWRRCT
jgi:F1F0 ATPase subunit 2